MSIRGFSDPETGWSFTCQVQENTNRTVEGGLVLNNVMHHGHRFADEIRVIGFWIDWEERRYVEGTSMLNPINETTTTRSKFFTLTSNIFEISDIQVFRPKNWYSGAWTKEFESMVRSGSAIGFSHFPFYFGLQVTYKSKPNIFNDIVNFDKSGLEIKQTHLFSKYSSMPSHEPSGGLTAARLHPLMTTHFLDALDEQSGESSSNVTSTASSIRFDYYIHLDLDRFLTRVENSMMSSLGNHAAIFKDNEAVDPIGTGSSLLSGLTLADGAVFSAAEKPLLREITAKGLDQGLPLIGDHVETSLNAWDNIHWWGAHLGYYPATPGAFHSAHLHWRWGMGASSITSEPQFLKSGVPDSVINHEFNNSSHVSVLSFINPSRTTFKNGALVDPNCWIQTIRFAIVFFRKERAPSGGIDGILLKNFSRKNFNSLFSSDKNSYPERISISPNENGADLVLWISIEVETQRVLPETNTVKFDVNGQEYDNVSERQEVRSSLNGTIFVHGIFFAHDPEPSGFSKTIGTRSELYYPSSKSEIIKGRKWERY